MVKKVGEEVDIFVRKRWREREWETAWFVNPPVSYFPIASSYLFLNAELFFQRLQSVPDLSHIHVFARRKTREEIKSLSHNI